MIMIMLHNAPRGHTSIYFCDFIRSNWDDWKKYIPAAGYNSVNQYTNILYIQDFKNNAVDILNGAPLKKPETHFDIYQPMPRSLREMSKDWTNGYILDWVNLVGDWRTLGITELKRRNVKI